VKQHSLRPLFTSEEIQQKTRALARKISADYRDGHIIVIGVLKGSFVFLADIIRHLTLETTIDFVQISSYGSFRHSTGSCTLKKDVGVDIAGRDVLVVEDIIDTGETLHFLLRELRKRNPASLKVCSLVDKPSSRTKIIPVDYFGFTVGDNFIVGFGLDYDERYRSLPGIYALED